MQINRRLAAQFDWPIFVLAIGLALTGIMTIYSATCDATDNCTGFLAKKQAYWLIIGIGVMIAFPFRTALVTEFVNPTRGVSEFR